MVEGKKEVREEEMGESLGLLASTLYRPFYSCVLSDLILDWK